VPVPVSARWGQCQLWPPPPRRPGAPGCGCGCGASARVRGCGGAGAGVLASSVLRAPCSVLGAQRWAVGHWGQPPRSQVPSNVVKRAHAIESMPHATRSAGSSVGSWVLSAPPGHPAPGPGGAVAGQACGRVVPVPPLLLFFFTRPAPRARLPFGWLGIKAPFPPRASSRGVLPGRLLLAAVSIPRTTGSNPPSAVCSSRVSSHLQTRD
jgi:hypothetical protein